MLATITTINKVYRKLLPASIIFGVASASAAVTSVLLAVGMSAGLKAPGVVESKPQLENTHTASNRTKSLDLVIGLGLRASRGIPTYQCLYLV